MREFSAEPTADLAGKAPEWIMLLPRAGEVKARDGRVFLADDLHRIVLATRRYHGATDVVVDYHHQTLEADKSGIAAKAAGWIKEFRVGGPNGEKGIWGRVEWTSAARRAIEAREFRYVSPTWIVPRTKSKVLRIVRIQNVALLNNPALTMPALSGAKLEGESVMDITEGQAAALRASLNLEDGAGGMELVTAVRTLKESVSEGKPDPAKYVPIEMLEAATAELKRVNAGVTKERAEAAVDTAISKGVLPPFMREWAEELCTVNKPAFDRFCASVGQPFAYLMERSNASGAPPGGNTALTADEQALCEKMGLTAEDFRKYGASEQ